MKFKDEKKWKKFEEVNSKDSYSKEVVRYSKSWAELMEIKIDSGSNIEDIAKDTSHEADIKGISGFMYGCAVETLSIYWEYGEELRRWHNLDAQIGSEGEEANKKGSVLNPALLAVRRKNN